MKSPKSLPWKKIFNETLEFFKAPNRTLGIFFLIFFIIAIPSLPDFEEWRTLSPLKLWMVISFGLTWLFFSYFSSVVFVLWISGQASKKRQKLRPMIKAAYHLLIPLTILSIRGSLLSVLGFIALIIPGCYFAFKYELASTCLIIEGWQDNHPPIQRAEEIISKYKFSLIPLAVLLIVGWCSPFIFEWILKLNAIENSWTSRFFIALFDASVTIISALYATQATLYLLKNLKTSDSL